MNFGMFGGIFIGNREKYWDPYQEQLRIGIEMLGRDQLWDKKFIKWINLTSTEQMTITIMNLK
jgi:hypothetical protein